MRHPIWHRGFYELIIRSEKDLSNSRDYIVNNPAARMLDVNHPKNTRHTVGIEIGMTDIILSVQTP